MGIGTVQNRYGIFESETTVGGGRKKNGTEKIESKGAGRNNIGQNGSVESMDYMAFLQEKCEEILEKLRTGETEVSYPIGAESYTEREWDKFLKKFDDIQEDVRQKMEERFRKREEKLDKAISKEI